MSRMGEYAAEVEEELGPEKDQGLPCLWGEGAIL